MTPALGGGIDRDIVQKQMVALFDQHQKAPDPFMGGAAGGGAAGGGFLGQHPKLACGGARGVILVQGGRFQPVSGDIGAISGLGDGADRGQVRRAGQPDFAAKNGAGNVVQGGPPFARRLAVPRQARNGWSRACWLA